MRKVDPQQFIQPGLPALPRASASFGAVRLSFAKGSSLLEHTFGKSAPLEPELGVLGKGGEFTDGALFSSQAGP